MDGKKVLIAFHRMASDLLNIDMYSKVDIFSVNVGTHF